jgi:hypothetical protein
VQLAQLLVQVQHRLRVPEHPLRRQEALQGQEQSQPLEVAAVALCSHQAELCRSGVLLPSDCLAQWQQYRVPRLNHAN